MKIGDIVTRYPLTFADLDINELGQRIRRPYEGRVVYIHPKGCFHVRSLLVVV